MSNSKDFFKDIYPGLAAWLPNSFEEYMSVCGNWRGADGLWRTKHDGKVLIWRPDATGWEVEGDIEQAPKEEYGPVCARCNEVSPYAVKVDGFMCWACRQPH